MRNGPLTEYDLIEWACYEKANRRAHAMYLLEQDEAARAEQAQADYEAAKRRHARRPPGTGWRGEHAAATAAERAFEGWGEEK